MTTEALSSSTAARHHDSAPKRPPNLRERLREEAIVLGICAIPGMFVTGITLNAAPVLIAPLAPLLCGPDTTVRTGLKAIPGSRSGAEGFARCLDAAGIEGADIFAQAFFMGFFALTLMLYVAVRVSGILRDNGPRTA